MIRLEDGTRTESMDRRYMPWILWLLVLTAVTAGMVALRSTLIEAHVALAYLLVVLGGSSRHGGKIGIALAALSFLCFDWFFLPPFNTLTVAKPVDWIVLVAFLLTSVVAAQVFEKARSEASTARERVRELDHLASLGAETLNAGRAEDALVAISMVIRSALSLDGCAIYSAENEAVDVMCDVSETPSSDSPDSNQWHAHIETAAHSNAAVALGINGAVERFTIPAPASDAPWPAASDFVRLAIPLAIRERTVGVLTIERRAGIRLSPDQWRFLAALSYYAALGVERVRLVATAQSADALREASRLKDAVIASVSHDLRTPLTTIKALAAEIVADGDDRALTIEEETDRLNSMVADMLDIGRINSGTVSVNPEPNEAEDLVGAALQRIQGRSKGRAIRVSLESGEPLLIGRFDYTHTLRALVNLLENALKYSPDSEPVDLCVRREDAWLVFSVLDRGDGIAPADRARIFEPFYRGRGPSPDAGGSGLGLSIAHALAKAQGCSLVYEPRDRGGSVFSLRVPAVDLEELSRS